MAAEQKQGETFSAVALPWKENALEGFISEVTIKTHYYKHHLGYVKKLNAQAKNNDKLGAMSLEDIIKSNQVTQKQKNLAGQIWNHDFYWLSMQPEKVENAGAIVDVKSKIFDNFRGDGKDNKDVWETFHSQFEQRALTHFGSGWVWWVYDAAKGTTSIEDGHDAKNPLSDNLIPLLNIDIWEHAYYIDYKNDRNTYIKNFWKYIDWKRVKQRLDDAQKK